MGGGVIEASLLLAAHVTMVLSYGQLVDVHGKHAFRAPRHTDQRGPCAGLNSLANHGYLPRNGVATFKQSVDAVREGLGMGEDLAILFTAYAVSVVGNFKEYSIGGISSEVSFDGLIEPPQGLSCSHNRYEGDGSATRGDRYLCGQAFKLIDENFKALYDLVPPGGNYDLSVLNYHHSNRFDDSLHRNPFFFNAPISGMVTTAAHFFVSQMFANFTEEHPDGYLDSHVLKSFYAISGDDESLTYKFGHERIPENWYRRPNGFLYTLELLIKDFLIAFAKYPKFAVFGGNTGTVDSFTGIDPANITGGVYNAANLLEGNNAGCFFYQAFLAAPDFVRGLAYLPAEFGGALTGFRGFANDLGCPQLKNFDLSPIWQHPGYSASRRHDRTCH